jgi:hypothetical protein
MRESSARRTPYALAFVVAAALLASGCSGEARTAPKASPTPISDLNTSAMEIPRIEFCKLVPAAAVRRALDGKPDSAHAYGNGDEVAVPEVGTEVVHEAGCSWSTDEGATARAWVFARPVDAAFAREAIASSRETEGCRVDRDTAYGEPSLTQTCRGSDGSTRVRHAGLFGQTWLTCEVSDPGSGAATTRERADAWCVDVVNALNTAG